VNSITRAVTDDHALAEDAAQEVFIRLAKYAPFEKFTRPEMFQSYVAVIAMNAGRDQNRRRTRRGEHEEPLTDSVVDRAVDPGSSPEHQAEIRDLAVWIVGRLTVEEGELMSEMLQGTSLQVLARQYDTNYSTVAVRLFRLRRKVFKLFYDSFKSR
jgi:RNA polymerase sigma factor (sigma-70 family)